MGEGDNDLKKVKVVKTTEKGPFSDILLRGEYKFNNMMLWLPCYDYHENKIV